ncbi:hypothetical protein BJV82DRAFT_673406 [Fennellomyces sp. T-0311]|nr:hypothetical protein BJV82DRAFT_673406 [Fennellomyces sp. T-0311]
MNISVPSQAAYIDQPLPPISFALMGPSSYRHPRHEITTGHTNRNIEQIDIDTGCVEEHIAKKLERITVNSNVDVRDAIPNQGLSLNLNDIELKLAKIAFDGEFSKTQYQSVAQLLQYGMNLVHLRRKPINITTRTLAGLFYRLDKKSVGNRLPFKEVFFDVASVPDFPKEHVQDFRDCFGPMKLVHRDIFDLSQYIFSYKPFWDQTILRPEVLKRNNERIYQDIYTGKWWEELQDQVPVGAIILAIILSSDQTSISGSHRHKAWPLYLKLGNTPLKIRNKSKTRASRLLAYLPVLDCPKDGKNRAGWWPKAKCAIIQHCLSIILSPFANCPAYK